MPESLGHGTPCPYIKNYREKLLAINIYQAYPITEGVMRFAFPPYNSFSSQPNFRSIVRYWMASATWAGPMAASPSRSAMVRAIFKMRW
jgi:hypothetical protein